MTPEIVDVDDVRMAFGTDADRLLAPYSEIPSEFKNWNTKNKWTSFVSDWFYAGMEWREFDKVDGLSDEDAARVIRQARAAMGSWDIKHELKIAGVAHLLSCYFTDVRWTKGKGE